jgi:hypothetical protein
MQVDDEIPLLPTLIYLFRQVETYLSLGSLCGEPAGVKLRGSRARLTGDAQVFVF